MDLSTLGRPAFWKDNEVLAARDTPAFTIAFPMLRTCSEGPQSAQNGNSCFVARSELCRLAAPYAPLADQETELHKAKYLQASEFDLER